MKNDTISLPDKTNQLKRDLFQLTKDINFKKSKKMGEILESALAFVVRNYKNKNPYNID